MSRPTATVALARPRALAAALLMAGLSVAAAAMPAPTDGAAGASSTQRRLSTAAELAARLASLGPELARPAPAGGRILCGIQDADGNLVEEVLPLEQGDAAYSLVYISDGEVDQWVRFIVTPRFEGSPNAGQAQLFQTNDACNITTPFGITTWGLDRTSGPWALVVVNDRGLRARCDFEVLPSP